MKTKDIRNKGMRVRVGKGAGIRGWPEVIDLGASRRLIVGDAGPSLCYATGC